MLGGIDDATFARERKQQADRVTVAIAAFIAGLVVGTIMATAFPLAQPEPPPVRNRGDLRSGVNGVGGAAGDMLGALMA